MDLVGLTSAYEPRYWLGEIREWPFKRRQFEFHTTLSKIKGFPMLTKLIKLTCLAVITFKDTVLLKNHFTS